MAQFEISITADYVPNWGLQDAVREFFQNAKDEEDAHPDHAMRITYSARRKMLTVTSENVTLDRAVLLLGETSKRGTGARGQFGEGLALAILALVRAGYPIRIENGQEAWTADLRHSDAWDRQVLVIETRRLGQPRTHFQIQIDNVDQDDWVTMVRRCRFLPGADRDDIIIPVGQDTVILNRPGDVFVHGLWVAKMPKLVAGYDLHNIEVDRDRRIVETWTLRLALGRVWNDAIGAVPGAIDHAMSMIARGAEDIACLSDTIQWNATAATKQAIAARMAETHGPAAVLVTSTTDADRVKAAGLTPVIVSKTEKDVAEAATDQTLDQVLTAAHRNVIRVIGPDDIAAAGLTARWVSLKDITKMLVAPNPIPPISVVEFASPDTLGMYEDGEVKIAFRALTSHGPGQAIVTLCHEIGHAIVAAHGYDHAAATEMILEKAINRVVQPSCWPGVDGDAVTASIELTPQRDIAM